MSSESSSSNNVPIGWETRTTTMSEHDMKLGGVAASKFSTYGGKGKGIYDGDNVNNDVYHNSDEVRAHYYNIITEEQGQESIAAATSPVLSSSSSNNHSTNNTTTTTATLPFGWEQRQKSKALEEKQHGVFAKKESTVVQKGGRPCGSAEVGLVRVTTHTLETLAMILTESDVKIPMEERTALAAAMKRAMDAVAKC